MVIQKFSSSTNSIAREIQRLSVSTNTAALDIKNDIQMVKAVALKLHEDVQFMKTAALDSNFSAKLDSIRTLLSAPDPLTNHVQACSDRQANTGIWLLESDEYIRWREIPSNLWLYGVELTRVQ